ncbi:MAG: glycosyltransferase [Anaerolineales bacterium]
MPTRRLTKGRPAALLIVGEVRPGDDSQTFEEFGRPSPDQTSLSRDTSLLNDLPAYYSLIDVSFIRLCMMGCRTRSLKRWRVKNVIATPVGRTNELIENGKNGMLVNVNDANALAEKILELLDDREKCESLGKNARGICDE